MNKYHDRFLYYAGRKLVRVYTEVMLKLDVVRKAPIPKGAKILVANHPTTTDPFLVTSISREHSIILVKDVLFNIPFFGEYLRWAGHICVSEGAGQQAVKSALKYLRRGKTLIVFIEGDISPPTGGFGKPKTGAVRLALATGVPIIPVGIGIKKENIKLIYSKVGGIRELGTWYFWGPYAMTVGEPIKVTGDTENREEVRSLTGLVMKKVIALAHESESRI